MNDEDVVREFLIESNENLGRLDREMVELEQRPKDPDLLASIFRTIHTIKGTCGFLGFSTLEAITHGAESILSQLRDGKRELTPELVTLILEAIDAIKAVLVLIESSGAEGSEAYEELRHRLAVACSLTSADGAAMPAVIVAAPLDAAASPAAPASETDIGAVQKGASISDSTIRVDVGLLDKLMNLVGELVLARNQILQFNAQQDDSTLNATSQRLNLITTELQESVMKTRMQPIGVVWNKLPRVVRDLATTFGKQIQLDLDGADTELDKTIIEAIKDPLTHIVRNSCDHGIEKPEVRLRSGKPAEGRLTLRAYHEGGQVNIEIGDDGAGMDVQQLKDKAVQKGLLRPEQLERMSDREALSLIFRPGFSTAESITNVSGRGVGMDVVKTNVEKIGGMVDLLSHPGKGTTIKLKIPLTLAIIPGLVVSCGGERFVIPQVSLLELIRLEGESARKQIEWIHGAPVYRRRGKLLPIAHLNTILKRPATQGSDLVNIVVLQAEDQQFGLVVDGINDTQEIVVKPLGKQFKGLSCYAGATIMGDGRVALILDVLGIGQLSGVLQDTREQARAQTDQDSYARAELQTFLLFRAGSFQRLSVPLSLVARLEEVPRSKIEHASGRQVLQYRDRILPLSSLASILEPGAPDTTADRDPVQVVVFNSGQRSIGLLVDEIVDIVEDTVSVRREAERTGLLGSAVIGKRVTDLLDLHAVIGQTDERWFDAAETQASDAAVVLLADASAFSRALLRSSLEMAGYRVMEASDAEEALALMAQRTVSVVLSAVHLPPHGGLHLLEKMRSQPRLQAIPVLALASTAGELESCGEQAGGFDDCQLRFEDATLLRSVAKLAGHVTPVEAPAVVAGERTEQ